MIRLRGNMIAGTGVESRHGSLFEEASASVHRSFDEEIIRRTQSSAGRRNREYSGFHSYVCDKRSGRICAPVKCKFFLDDISESLLFFSHLLHAGKGGGSGRGAQLSI